MSRATISSRGYHASGERALLGRQVARERKSKPKPVPEIPQRPSRPHLLVSCATKHSGGTQHALLLC